MAVQAQMLSDAFVPDLRSWESTGGGCVPIDEQQLRMMSMFGSFTNLESQQQLLQKSHHHQHQQQPASNISGSRKRIRDQINDDDLSIPFGNNNPCHRRQIAGGATNVVFNNDNNSFEQQSTMTSTSGGASSIYDSRDNLISCLRNQNLEIDGIVRLQTERLRSVLEEATKRQCRTLLSVVERRVHKKLAEKDSEIERANRRSLMLEEKLKQLTAENQIWFGVARNNEAVVTTLRTNLQQILLRQNTNNNNQIAAAAAAAVPEEGFGDSGDVEEQQSGFYPKEEAEEDKKSEKQSSPSPPAGGCKSCGFGEPSILLLPCRHLCLCKSCQSRVDTCPVCHSASYGCIEVVVS